MRTVRNGLTFLRALGVLYGVACGDALGAPLEFWPEVVISLHCPFRIGDPRHMDGNCTDDTGMTLALARGLLRGGPDRLEDCAGQEFIQWLRTAPPGVGYACTSAISTAEGLLNLSYPSCDQTEVAQAWSRAARITEVLAKHPTDGNGALMRCSFCGLYARTRKQARKLATRQADMTHTGAIQRDACDWYAGVIWSVSRSLNPWRTWAHYRKRLPARFEPVGTPVNPKGTAEDTMRAVVYILDAFERYPEKDGVCKAPLSAAVALGGDTDTVASLVGGLLGAIYGVDAFPRSWRRALSPAIRSEILRVVQELFRG